MAFLSNAGYLHLSSFSYYIRFNHGFNLNYANYKGGSVGKEFACNAGDTGDKSLILGSGRPSGGGHGNPLQYSCMENAMDRGAWQTIIHMDTKSRTRLKWPSTHPHMLVIIDMKCIFLHLLAIWISPSLPCPYLNCFHFSMAFSFLIDFQVLLLCCNINFLCFKHLLVYYPFV